MKFETIDTKVFASCVRQLVLNKYQVRYSIDMERNFVFYSEKDKKRAIQLLDKANK